MNQAFTSQMFQNESNCNIFVYNVIFCIWRTRTRPQSFQREEAARIRSRSCQFLRRLVPIFEATSSDFWKYCDSTRRVVPCGIKESSFSSCWLRRSNSACSKIPHLKIPDNQNFPQRKHIKTRISRKPLAARVQKVKILFYVFKAIKPFLDLSTVCWQILLFSSHRLSTRKSLKPSERKECLSDISKKRIQRHTKFLPR